MTRARSYFATAGAARRRISAKCPAMARPLATGGASPAPRPQRIVTTRGGMGPAPGLC